MWIKIGNSLVDIDRYRLFLLDGNRLEGLNEYESGESRITEEIAAFPTDEQAEEAFLEFANILHTPCSVRVA